MGKALLCLVLLLCGVSLGSFGVYNSEIEFLQEESKVNPNVYESLPIGHPLRTVAEEERQGAMPSRARAVHETRATQTPRPYDGAPELTNSASGHTIGGYIPGNRFSIFDTYIINLAAGQVADLFFTVSEGKTYYNFQLEVYLISTSGSWSDYLDKEYNPTGAVVKFNTTLAQHCPAYAATYYFVLQSDSLANYTVTVQKRNPNLAVGSYKNYMNFANSGYIGIPVSGTCQKLTVTASFSNNFYSYFYRGCDSSGYTCDATGKTTTEITSVQSVLAQVRTAQYNIDCTSSDQYYLYLGSVSRYSQINITIHTGGYPCSEMCKQNGICNTDTGVCKCKGGFSGDNCDKQYDQPVVDIPVDGSTFNYTNNVITYTTYYPIRIVMPAGLPASKFVLVNVTVMPRTSNAPLYFYWNADSMPSNSNYSTNTYISTSSSTPVNRVIPLCSQVSAWYIGVADQVVPYGYDPAPVNNILFTITTIDIPVITDTFGGQYPENLNGLSPFSFFLYTAAYTKSVIRVDEGTPAVYGVSVTPSCAVFDRIVGAADAGTHVQHYQVAFSSAVNTPYYVVVQSTVVGATFSGSVSEGTTGSCANNCGGSSRGFCSKSNECVCRYGWTGATCADVDMNGVSSFGSTPVDITVPVGAVNYKLAARQQLSVEPGWYQTTTMKASTSGVKYWSQSGRLPNTYSSSNAGTLSTTDLVDFPSSVCLINQAPFYYAFTATSDTTVTVSTTQYDMTIPLDGTVKTFNQFPSSRYVPFYVPINTQSCPKAVRITVGVEDVSKFNYFYPTSSYVGQNCATTNTFRATNTDNTAMAAIVAITNCSQPVTGYLYYYSGSYMPTLQVKAEPVSSNTPVILQTDPCNDHGDFNATGDGTCICYYPWISANCSVFDVKCSAIASKLTTCATNDDVVFYNNDFLGQQTCDMRSTDTQIAEMIKEDVEQLNNNNYFPGKAMKMSDKCQAEYKGILCSYYFKKCNPQEGGGVKLSLPCEALTFADRCTNGLYTYNMQDTISDIKETIENGNPYYTCGSVNGAGSTTTTTGTTSAASGVHASIAVVVILSVLACFL